MGFKAVGFNKSKDASENSDVSEGSTEENIPPPPPPIRQSSSKVRKYISLSPSWEESDKIDDQLFDKFAKSQTRANIIPVVVNILNRRVDDRSSLRCPYLTRIEFDDKEILRRQFISKFSWIPPMVMKVIDQSTLEKIADKFLNHVKRSLQREAIPKMRLDLGVDLSDPKSRVFEFTTPGASYYIQLEDNGECAIVPDPASSPYAIVDIHREENVEDLCRKKLGKNANFQFVPSNHCQRLLAGKVFNKKSRLIRFDAKIQKVMMSSKVRDAPICVAGSFDYTKTFESVSINVRYNSMVDMTGIARLNLKEPKDVQFAENVLLKHGLLLRYANDKYGYNSTEMLLTKIPTFVDNDDYLTWFVSQIFDQNRIGLEKVQFDTTPVRKLSEKNSLTKVNLHPDYIMAYELIRLVCKEKLRPDFNIKTVKDLNEFVSNTRGLPFRLLDRCYDNGEKMLSAQFYDGNVELGKELASLCLLNMPDTDFMRFTSSRVIPARIYPVYRKMLPVSRSIRNACKARVESVEDALKKWLQWDATYHPDNENSKENERNSAKIIDDYVPDSEDGFTGVVGWPPSLVDTWIGHLMRAFAPQSIDCTDKHEHFLYGIGETYVRSFVEQNMIFVDFDRYRSKLTFYGDASEAFLVHLENFESVKNSSLFEGSIPISQPTFQKVAQKILTVNVLKALGKSLNATITINKPSGKLLFLGSCQAYEIMVDLVASMNREILTTLCENSLNYSQCPVCQCTISANYYRLEDCGHSYCYSCMNNMVRSFVGNAQFNMKCCFEKCGRLISPGDVKRIILGDETRAKSLDAEKLHTLNARAIESIVTRPGSTFKVCKTIDCNGLLQSSRGSGQTNAKCVNCGNSYCIQCLEEPHPQIESCEVYERMRRDAEYSLQKYTSTTGDEKFRRCPTENCKAVIEKADGCNHVECPYCHCHFCWICLLRTEKMSDLYKHMTEEHGGTGGEWRMDVDDAEMFAGADETLDADFQHFLLAPGRP